MMTFKRTLLAAACFAGMPFAAHAEKPTFYVGMGGGYNNLMDSDIEGTGVNTEAEFDDGWAGILTAGAKLSYGFRTELELGYRSNDIDNIGGAPVNDGEFTSWSALVNVLYDFRNQSAFTPYIGAGAGVARLNMDDVRVGGVQVVDDEDTNAVVQGIAGVTYTAHPNVELFLDYRYLTAIDAQFETTAGTDIDADYDNNTVMVGVRYVFARKEPGPIPQAPAPAPEPAPVQAMPSSYMVFFDFDRADITPEARETIAKAAADVKSGKMSRLQVTGHTDRSGTDKYNQRLSERRAAAVKRELNAQGVSSSDIGTSAKGESSPLVPTGDGVKEPQNRRAEIVIEGAK